MYVAILVGNVLSILATVSKVSDRYRQRLEGIQTLMLRFSLPKHLRRQLRKWVVRAVAASAEASTILGCCSCSFKRRRGPFDRTLSAERSKQQHDGGGGHIATAA